MKKFGCGEFQRYGDQTDILQAYVAFAALDATQVASVQPDDLCEFFLAPTSRFTELPYPISEEYFHIGLCHGVHFRA